MSKTANILDTGISYNSVDDKDVLRIISAVRSGIKFAIFISIVRKSPFTLNEWSGFLHLSERTMQRYKREKKTFDPLHSEKILEIALLDKLGVEIFGSKEKFNAWLEAENLALGKIKPKTFLDSSFGIGLLKDELTRIEYGVLA
jgi:putative toxin-antitoxin system antitoxin component (TIGR02293 family)